MPHRILTTPAITEPITLAEAKKHLQVDADWLDDDAYITSLISVARNHIETETGRLLAQANVEIYNDDFLLCCTMPWYPAEALISIAYKDINGSDQTIDLNNNGNVIFNKYAKPATLILQNMPDTYKKTAPLSVNNVTLTIRAGYGSSTFPLPTRLKQALLVVIRDMYDNRESAGNKNTYETSVSVNNLIQYFRLYEFH